MNPKLFETFRQLVLRESGIVLNDDKKQLLANRIRKRLKALGILDEQSYLDYLMGDGLHTELVNLLDAISTNVTYFYREPEHFKHLEQHLESLKQSGTTRIRIWCAASSTGEEPYMLGLICSRVFPSGDAKVLATDISYSVLQKAVAGVYEERQLQKMPRELVHQYFRKVGPEQYSVVDALRERVVFKRLNLSHFPFPLKGPLDAIFCRNVMIYFNADLKQKICNEFVRLLASGGNLYLGQSESLLGISHSLDKEGVSIYRKPVSHPMLHSGDPR